MMPDFLANDPDLGRMAKILRNNERRNCLSKLLGTSAGCWCMGAAPGGGNVSCFEATDRKAERALITDAEREAAKNSADLSAILDPGFTAGLDPVEYLEKLHEGTL
jgi:hypothetical protein